MKGVIFILALLFSIQVFAQDNSDSYYNYSYPQFNYNSNYNSNFYNFDNSRPHEDIYGNNYKYYGNMFKDKDNDGLTGFFDNNDADRDTYKSLFKSNNSLNSNYLNQNYEEYNSSYYDFNRSKTIYVGPKGGEYYINSNGNKTYIKK